MASTELVYFFKSGNELNSEFFYALRPRSIITAPIKVLNCFIILSWKEN